MSRVVSFVNQKGGVGKTTSAINLASYLALRGRSALLVDLDPQSNATSGLGARLGEFDRNLYHVLLEHTFPEEAIRNTEIFGLDILPSSPELAGATVDLIGHPNREFRLKETLGNISKQYDYIIVDSPPSLGILTINGLAAADKIIIPVQCEYYALEGLGQLLETVKIVNENLGLDVGVMGALLTMYDRRNKLAQEVAKEVRRNFPGYVFNAIIPRSTGLAESPSFGKTILQFDPSSKGALAYDELAREVIGMEMGTVAGETSLSPAADIKL